MLPCEVACQSAKLLRKVTTMILSLLKFSHDSVSLEELLRPESLILHLLTHLTRQDFASLLRVENLGTHHRETFMHELNV